MSRDQLLIARPYSKGALAAAAETTPTNAVNSLCIPPGLYDVEVSYGATTGTPTGLTATVYEQGYTLGTAPPATTSTDAFAVLADSRTRTIASPTASGDFFLRGVRITKWNQGQPNAGIGASLAGGTAPTIPNFQVTFWPQGRARGFNGLP